MKLNVNILSIFILSVLLGGCSTPSNQSSIENQGIDNSQNSGDNNQIAISKIEEEKREQVKKMVEEYKIDTTGMSEKEKEWASNERTPDKIGPVIKEVEDKTKDGNGQIWFEKKYSLPGGKDTFLGGNLTLENGIIKDIQIKTDTKGKINFFEGIKSKVIGKNIKGLQIDSVSGASLSSKAFNEILNEYK